MARRSLYIVAALVVLGGVASVRADLPAIRLTSVFPPGARAGTTVEVTVTGDDLDDLAELRFSHPGLFARPATDAAGNLQPNRFIVAAAPGVPVGVYDVRAVGRFGVSLPRSFAVGDGVERVEAAGNESPGGATEVTVGGVVNGVCSAGAVDHFKFAAKQGQRVFIHCAVKGIDSRAEPVVALFDAGGREVGRSRTGGVIDFTPPADGQYLVHVHDVTFRGGPAFFYRLSVSTGPWLDFVVPPAGKAGTRGKFVLYGRNLPGATDAAGLGADGKPLQQLPVEIELPADTGGRGRALFDALPAARGFAYCFPTDRGVSNPVFIAFTENAPAPEPADNDKPDQPAKLTPPCDVAGQFYPQRDRDWFALDAKKGDVWRVDVFSHRLGAPADPFLLVQRVTTGDKGETQSADVQEVYDSDSNAGGADFNTASRDPSYRLEAKEDGAYRVQVRDLFNTTRDDPRLGYVLSVRKETPDFELFVAPVRGKAAELPGPPLLRRGGAVPLRVVAVRRDGFGGEIALSVEGLPPGVSCGGATVAAGSGGAALVLTAAEGATSWAGAIKVVGKAQVAGAEVVRAARGACVVVNAGEPPTAAVRSRVTADLAVGVSGSDLAPVFVEPAEAKVYEGTVGGKVAVPLKLAWRADAAGRFKVKVGGHPALDNFTDVEIDAKAATAGVEVDLNKHKLPPGTHTLYARAEGKVKYVRNPEALKAAEEAKGAAEKAATDAGAAAKQAAEKLTAAKAGGDAEAVKAAEKVTAETDAAAKAAEQKKAEAVKRVAELGAKEVEGIFYSAPVVVKVVAPAEKK